MLFVQRTGLVQWMRCCLYSRYFCCRARHTFTKHVRPILEAAGFHLDVRETQGPGHATDIVKEAELQIFDAVVAVGGDGTIFEILQVREKELALVGRGCCRRLLVPSSQVYW